MPERRSEAEMTEDDDDLSGEGGDEALDDFDRLTDSLYQRVLEFTEDEDVDDEIVPILLLRLSLSTRMMGYAISVARPSAGGLRLDLDRFRREAEDLIRVMKKDADRFIAQAQATIAAAMLEEDET
jgi:hypothetical protein